MGIVIFYAADMDLRDTKKIGDYSELAVMAALIKAGYRIAIPFGENHRYDLIADRDGTLFRVQVKTGRLRGGVIKFNCYSVNVRRAKPGLRTYVGEIEAFGVYCPELDEVYFIPANDVVDLKKPCLRLNGTRNGQAKRLRWAAQYRLTLPGRDSERLRRTVSKPEAPS